MGRGKNKEAELSPRKVLLGRGSEKFKLKTTSPGDLSEDKLLAEEDKSLLEQKKLEEMPPSIVERGNKFWTNAAGELHRDGDLPAGIWADGTKAWYQNGKKHRDGDKPAETWPNGSKFWHQNGKYHRDGDKPALIWADGDKRWYQNGKLHRDGDEPAVIDSDGRKEWWFNDVKLVPPPSHNQ